MNKRKLWLLELSLVFSFFLLVFGCEQAFEPLQENDQYLFTMYGTLDVHADTQWVRVMPIGQTLIPTDTIPNQTKVTLIRESTGKATVLRDSLFRFGGSAYAWNYWTTEPIHPKETYSLIAETPDGEQSTSQIHTPSQLPIPNIEYSPENEQGFITGTSADPLVTVEMHYMVQAVEYGCFPEREIIFSHLDDIVTDGNGKFSLKINHRLTIAGELGVTAFGYNVNHRKLVIISGSEDWPDFADLNEEEIVLPDVISNVENGTGLIAGIANRTIEITPRREPC